MSESVSPAQSGTSGRKYGNPEAKRIVKILKQIEEGLETDHILQAKALLTQMVENVKDHGSSSNKLFDEHLHKFVNIVIFKAGISVNLIKQAVRGFLMMQRQPDLGDLVSKEISLHLAEEFPSLARIGMMDNETLDVYIRALVAGVEKVRHIRLMVVGMFGVGKTCLIRKICNKEIDDVESTVGVDVSVNACEVDEDGKWKVKVSEKDENDIGGRMGKIMEQVAAEDGGIREHDKPANSKTKQQTPVKKPATRPTDQPKVPAAKHKEKIKFAQTAMNKFTENQQPGFGKFVEKIQPVIPKKKSIPKEVRKPTRNTSVSIWDFAGQSVYYSTHHFFLSSRSIYLLVLDISRDLDEKVPENKGGDYHKDMDNIFLEGCLPEGFTCKDALRFWINSIYTYTKEEEKQARTDGSTCMTKQYQPTIVLVGTHKDKLKGSDNAKEQYKDEYFSKALKSFKNSPVRRMIHHEKFLVSCKEDSPEVFDKIKSQIFDIAKTQPFWEETSPAKWIPLERSIEERKAKGQKCMTFDELGIMNAATEFPLSNKPEIKLFLQFQHFLGILLFYNVGELDHKVILNPQWIIDVFKLFVTHQGCFDKQEVEDAWNDYKEKAKLIPKLMYYLIDQSNKKRTEAEHLLYKDVVEYMKYLDVMAMPVIYSQEEKPQQEEFFIVPCVLKKMTPEEAKKQKIYFQPDQAEAKMTPVLCFAFDNGFLPPAVFHRLLATCIRKWEISKSDTDYLLYNGMGVFKLDANSTLTLWYAESVICMRIANYSQKLSSKDCVDVKVDITNMLKQILLLDIQKRLKKDESEGVDKLFKEHILCEKKLETCVDILFKDPCKKDLWSVTDFDDNESILCECGPRPHSIKKEVALKYWYMESAEPASQDAIQKLDEWFKNVKKTNPNLEGTPEVSELNELAAYIGDEYWDMGIRLGLDNVTLEQIREGHIYDVRGRIKDVLLTWRKSMKTHEEMTYTFLQSSIKEARIKLFKDSNRS